MAGMLAARVLADRFERVTVIERDQLPADARQRRGVPQGHHFHTVLVRGTQVLESLFPGLVDDLVGAGAHRPNLLRDTRLVVSGHELCRADTGYTVQMTRPLLESGVRARLAEIPHVKVVDQCEVVRPRVMDGRVTGVRIAHRGGRPELLDADLVVDAMGRAGRAATWLSDLGYPAPAEERITSDIAYVSCLVRVPAGPADRLVLVGPKPGRPRGFALAAQEDDRWMLTVVGMAGDHPPTDFSRLVEFIAEAVPSDVQAVIRAAVPVGEPRVHRFPASVRRRYERLRRFPVGLLAFGDSICSFNPIYGQGMTVAALQAVALRECLGSDRLARRFYRAAARIVSPAWQLNAGGDLALPEVKGHRSLTVRLVNRYVARVQHVAERDPAVAAAFMNVAGLVTPPSALLSPTTLTKVL
jgi:2-polyprenyl-6-methoxyphenol hydroxylase-like FAD-dependent oxidoreductase